MTTNPPPPEPSIRPNSSIPEQRPLKPPKETWEQRWNRARSANRENQAEAFLAELTHRTEIAAGEIQSMTFIPKHLSIDDHRRLTASAISLSSEVAGLFRHIARLGINRRTKDRFVLQRALIEEQLTSFEYGMTMMRSDAEVRAMAPRLRAGLKRHIGASDPRFDPFIRVLDAIERRENTAETPRIGESGSAEDATDGPSSSTPRSGA